MAPDPLLTAADSSVTSISLLVRVKAHDQAAWRRLVLLYRPMIYRWARKAGLSSHDALDVVQNVFVAVATDIHQFRRRRLGDSFRGWLWTISQHKIVDFFRELRQKELVNGTAGAAEQRFQPCATLQPDLNESRDDVCRLRHRALALLRGEFDKQDWEGFLRTAVHGDRPADVAQDLGVSVATIYRAKFRVLTRLRAELDEK